MEREKSDKKGRIIEVSARIRIALKHHELATNEDVTWAELGRRVGAALGVKPVDSSTLSRWKNGQQEPSGDEMVEIGRILNCDPGWLTYGELSRAPSPTDRSEVAQPAAIPTSLEAAPASAPQAEMLLTDGDVRRFADYFIAQGSEVPDFFPEPGRTQVLEAIAKRKPRRRRA